MLERIRFTRSPGVYSLLYSMFFVVIFPIRSYDKGEIELGYSTLPLPVQTREVHYSRCGQLLGTSPGLPV